MKGKMKKGFTPIPAATMIPATKPVSTPADEKLEEKTNGTGENAGEKEKDAAATGDEKAETPKYFCALCKLDCKSSSSYKTHMESWRHRAEVDKEKVKEKARRKFEEDAEKTFDMAEEAERKKVPDNITAKAGYFCEVCSIASEDESHYLEHLKTRKHFRQVRPCLILLFKGSSFLFVRAFFPAFFPPLS